MSDRMRWKENKSNVGLGISKALFPPLLLLLLCKQVDDEVLIEKYCECKYQVDVGLVDNTSVAKTIRVTMVVLTLSV